MRRTRAQRMNEENHNYRIRWITDSIERKMLQYYSYIRLPTLCEIETKQVWHKVNNKSKIIDTKSETEYKFIYALDNYSRERESDSTSEIHNIILGCKNFHSTKEEISDSLYIETIQNDYVSLGCDKMINPMYDGNSHFEIDYNTECEWHICAEDIVVQDLKTYWGPIKHCLNLKNVHLSHFLMIVSYSEILSSQMYFNSDNIEFDLNWIYDGVQFECDWYSDSNKNGESILTQIKLAKTLQQELTAIKNFVELFWMGSEWRLIMMLKLWDSFAKLPSIKKFLKKYENLNMVDIILNSIATNLDALNKINPTDYFKHQTKYDNLNLYTKLEIKQLKSIYNNIIRHELNLQSNKDFTQYYLDFIQGKNINTPAEFHHQFILPIDTKYNEINTKYDKLYAMSSYLNSLYNNLDSILISNQLKDINFYKPEDWINGLSTD